MNFVFSRKGMDDLIPPIKWSAKVKLFWGGWKKMIDVCYQV